MTEVTEGKPSSSFNDASRHLARKPSVFIRASFDMVMCLVYPMEIENIFGKLIPPGKGH